MSTGATFIEGTCRQLLFSPRGDIEGVLVGAKRKLVQVSMQADIGAIFARVVLPGSRVSVLAEADHSPKTRQGAHPVYRFVSFADASGHAIRAPHGDAARTSIKGTVAAVHYARHGQPNGVILDSGDFIHLRPGGMEKSGLCVGSQVTAVGDVHPTLLGNRLLEAHKVNGVALD